MKARTLKFQKIEIGIIQTQKVPTKGRINQKRFFYSEKEKKKAGTKEKGKSIYQDIKPIIW